MKARGVTLVEVLLSLGLVAAALITIVSVFLAGLQATRLKQQTSVAEDLCRQIVERSKELSGLPGAAQVFDGGVPDPGVGGFPPSPYPQVTVDGQTYQITVSIRPQSGEPDCYLLQVTTRWGNHRADAETLLYAI